MKVFLVLFTVILVNFCGFSASHPYKTNELITEDFVFPYQKKPANESVLRIVGGQEATPHQFPYQVGLYISKNMETDFCGGSLISNNYVLTAAHCALGAISIEVVLGAHTITETEPSQLRQTSREYVVHPEWSTTTLTNDIALVKLPTPVTENSSIKITKLPSTSDTYAGQAGTVTGWGITGDDGKTITANLRYVSNDILSNQQCIATDASYASVIKPSHLCLSGAGNKGICKGDSGGPLMANGVQVGVVSFGYKLCEQSKPSVFTRISEFLDWIRQNSDVGV